MSEGSVAKSERTALRVAAVVLLALVVAPFVVTGVPAVIGAEESFVVLSGSMNEEPDPIIHPGDVVIVDRVNPVNIEEQDIITFTTGAREPVTHRVVNITEQNGQLSFRTKGDANEDADPQLVGTDQVIGEVILVIPLVGHVVNFANTTQGFVLLVLLPIGLLVLSEAWNLMVSSGDSSAEDGGAESVERPLPAGRNGTGTRAGAITAGLGAKAEDGAGQRIGENGDGGRDDGPATITLDHSQLKWVAVGLLPVAAATGYAAFGLQTAWIITVFYASVGLFVLSVLLYWRTGLESTASTAGPGKAYGTERTRRRTAPGGPEDCVVPGSHSETADQHVVEDGVHRNPVVPGRIEEGANDRSHVEVTLTSREDLVRMALQKRAWIVHDTDAETYVLFDDGKRFYYNAETETTTTDRDWSSDETNGPGKVMLSSNWEVESGWIAFSGAGHRKAWNRADGSDGPDERGEKERTTAPRDGAEPPKAGAERVEDESGPTGEDFGSAGAGETSTADTDDEPKRSCRDEDVTPAIRRLEHVEAGESDDSGVVGTPAQSCGGAVENPADSDGVDRVPTDDSVKTDGGTTEKLPRAVGTVGWLVALPIRALELVGYVVLELALYHVVRPTGRDDGSDPQADGRTELGS